MLKLVNIGQFLPLYTLRPPSFQKKQPKNQSFRKIKKSLEISPFYTCVPKPQSYEVWFLRYGVRQTEVSLILGHFLPCYPPNNPGNHFF